MTSRRNLLKSIAALPLAPLALLGLKAKAEIPPDAFYTETWGGYRAEIVKLLPIEPYGLKPGQEATQTYRI